ncbi:MAG: AI-2E family transporter [Dermatophilaceae bacterium]|nr:AI-2E family transporter [Intrasporangiaceae bacterium]
MSRFSLRRTAVERLRHARAEAEQPRPMPRPQRQPSATPDQHPVPKPIRDAAEWAWRILIIAAAVLVVLMAVSRISTIVVPVLVAILLAALLQPLYHVFVRAVPRGLAAGLTVIALVLILTGAFTIIGRTLSGGLGDVTEQVLQGIDEIRAWTRDTFGISNFQIDGYIARAREAVTDGSGDLGPLLAQVGITAGHFIAGFFIALFALFFFLYDGDRIWGWVVRFFPGRVRPGVHDAGHIAWAQLSSFTRATIVVALADATGITLVAILLDVPFPAIIFLFVFIGAFVPIVGGGLSGTIAVLLALVAHGPITALLMLAGVIAVQQIESHLLQPLLLGRVMKLHPLGVILAIAAGIVLAGITGALIAVPVVAVLNAVGKYYLADEDVTASDEGLLDPEQVTDQTAH